MTRYPVNNPIFYDLEVYPGWFLAGFMLLDGTTYQYDIDANTLAHVISLRDFLNWAEGAQLVGFNSSGYDDLVLTAFLRQPDPQVAYQTSVDIIANQVPRWKFDNDINSVDLMPVLPGRMSLKKIGVCLGHAKLQELPVPWDKTPTPEEQQVLIDYNKNDLVITQKLYNEVLPDLKLRQSMSDQYGIDLRSKGEATLAEMIILEESRRLGGPDSRRQLNDIARHSVDAHPQVWVREPTWWSALTTAPEMQQIRALGDEIFQTPIQIVADRLERGSLKRTVFIDDRYYAMGVGGLHSIDSPGSWKPRHDEVLFDIDVASYYPNIILTQDLWPRQWGPLFLQIYRDIVTRRMKAKREGDKTTAQVLKIAANGTYGKSSDLYSSLYDPQLTANVTVLGQLGLLTIIKMLEGTATVCSANTDGITVLCKRDLEARAREIVSQWEKATGFEMEYTEYTELCQKDVNNYIAVMKDGGVKTKGAFIDTWPDLRHTPSANIIATAVKRDIAEGVPIDRTVFECTDINQFVLTQNVSKDWTTRWNDQPLGNVLRFYKSTRPDAAPIMRTPGEGAKGNRGNVPDSDHCVPLEDIPDTVPPDLNYPWYVDQAKSLRNLISRPKQPGMNRWAETLHGVGLSPCWVDPYAKQLSRARVTRGDTDFTSQPPGHVLGTGTGGNLIARREGDNVEVFMTRQHYPTRTRAKVKKDHGFDLIYGARVSLSGSACYMPSDIEDFDEWYTPAELKKVGR